jgi:hypothetical protein
MSMSVIKFDIYVLISYPLKDVRVYAYCFRTRNAFVSLLYMTDMDIIYKTLTILDHIVSILVFFGPSQPVFDLSP